VSQDTDSYGVRESQSGIDRLLEDCRTLSPSGIERIAQSWQTGVAPGWIDRVTGHHEASSAEHDAWHQAERAALHVLEATNRAPAWDDLRNRILDLTEHHDALVSWREEHGEVGHRAEDALLGAALALSARPELDGTHERIFLGPLSATLPWLTARS
jgi:hypothetical protein